MCMHMWNLIQYIYIYIFHKIGKQQNKEYLCHATIDRRENERYPTKKYPTKDLKGEL